MNICIIGTGYVGLVTGTCLADFFIAVGNPRQVPPSLRATEGSVAIPTSVIPAKAGIHPSFPSPLRGEGRVRVKYSSVIAREQSDRSNPNLNRRTGVSPVYPIPFDLASIPEFRNLDLTKIKKLLKTPILLDLRNLYEPATLKSLGFIYEGVGRK